MIDPYVTVEVFGFPFDQQKHKTAFIRNNGFNPVWNDSFDLPVRVPELALLRITVKDYDKTSSNDFIGQYTCPFSAVRKGHYRFTSSLPPPPCANSAKTRKDVQPTPCLRL